MKRKKAIRSKKAKAKVKRGKQGKKGSKATKNGKAAKTSKRALENTLDAPKCSAAPGSVKDAVAPAPAKSPTEGASKVAPTAASAPAKEGPKLELAKQEDGKAESPPPNASSPATVPRRVKRKSSQDHFQVKTQPPSTPEQLRECVVDNLQRCSTKDLESIALLIGAPELVAGLKGTQSDAASAKNAENQGAMNMPAAAPDSPVSTGSTLPGSETSSAKPAAEQKPAAKPPAEQKPAAESEQKQLTQEQLAKQKADKLAAHARYMRFSRSLFRLLLSAACVF